MRKSSIVPQHACWSNDGGMGVNRLSGGMSKRTASPFLSPPASNLRQTDQKAKFVPRMKLAANDALSPTPTSVAVAVERIAAACKPRAILVFGSRARGQARPDSDLDLFVLLHAPNPDDGALRCRLRALLADLPFSKDILVSDPETFARWRKQPNSVYRDIAQDSFHLWRNGRVDAAAIKEVCR